MGHELYTKDDFTWEEIASDNVLAIAVVFHDFKICKLCEKAEDELLLKCKSYRKELRQLYPETYLEFDESYIQIHPNLHPRFYGTISGRTPFDRHGRIFI